MAQQIQSIYPRDQIPNDSYYPSAPNQINFNINEIKKYEFPDSIQSYFNYFEMWTPRLSGDERKILLNRLLQDNNFAFSIYLENINESYDTLKTKLIDQFTEYDEGYLKEKKEKKHKRKIFKKMTKEEMQEYIRTTYNQLNTLTKESLVIRELVRSLPKKYAKKFDLKNKCNTVDQIIKVLDEKFNNIKLNDSEKDKKTKRHQKKNFSQSSSSSSGESDEERVKNRHHLHLFHHKRHGLLKH